MDALDDKTTGIKQDGTARSQREHPSGSKELLRRDSIEAQLAASKLELVWLLVIKCWKTKN